MTMTTPGHTAVIRLVINDMAVLRTCYMPFLQSKGLFVPSQQSRALGDTLFVVLSLPGHASSAAGIARVCWITPGQSRDGRIQGYGLHFDKQASSLRTMIESVLEADSVNTESISTSFSHTL